MTKKYYKILNLGSIIMFCYNPEKDCLEGVIEEMKTGSKLLLMKHQNGRYYAEVKDNLMAQGMINNAIEIEKEEYDIALDVINAMIDTEEMYLDVNVPIKANEVKAELTYV